jgi:hypothetical protein
MVGEQFSKPNEVLGVVLSLKFNGDSISVWHLSADSQTVEQLKADIKRFVFVDDACMKMDSEIFADVISQPRVHRESRGGRGGFRGSRGRGNRGGYNNAPRTEDQELLFDRGQKTHQ